jgi:hypothetical protein
MFFLYVLAAVTTAALISKQFRDMAAWGSGCRLGAAMLRVMHRLAGSGPTVSE